MIKKLKALWKYLGWLEEQRIKAMEKSGRGWGQLKVMSIDKQLEEILDLFESVMGVAVLPITLDRERVLDSIEELRRKLDYKK